MTSSIILILVPVLLVVPFVFIPRFHMEQRAHALLSQHPNAERTSVYLAFRSGWTGKRREMDDKIAEMVRAGWTFLRAREASPFRTIRTWGGGLTLQFIRTHSDVKYELLKKTMATKLRWISRSGGFLE